jgi:hypothetical protein
MNPSSKNRTQQRNSSEAQSTACNRLLPGFGFLSSTVYFVLRLLFYWPSQPCATLELRKGYPTRKTLPHPSSSSSFASTPSSKRRPASSQSHRPIARLCSVVSSNGGTHIGRWPYWLSLQLRVFALKQLDYQVDLLWTEIADSIGLM